MIAFLRKVFLILKRFFGILVHVRACKKYDLVVKIGKSDESDKTEKSKG